MNGYFGLQAAQVIYEERIRKHREPIVLAQPRKARRRRETGEENTHPLPGFVSVLQSAARAIASVLM